MEPTVQPVARGAEKGGSLREVPTEPPQEENKTNPGSTDRCPGEEHKDSTGEEPPRRAGGPYLGELMFQRT